MAKTYKDIKSIPHRENLREVEYRRYSKRVRPGDAYLDDVLVVY